MVSWEKIFYGKSDRFAMVIDWDKIQDFLLAAEKNNEPPWLGPERRKPPAERVQVSL